MIPALGYQESTVLTCFHNKTNLQLGHRKESGNSFQQPPEGGKEGARRNEEVLAPQHRAGPRGFTEPGRHPRASLPFSCR